MKPKYRKYILKPEWWKYSRTIINSNNFLIISISYWKNVSASWKRSNYKTWCWR